MVVFPSKKCPGKTLYMVDDRPFVFNQITKNGVSVKVIVILKSIGTDARKEYYKNDSN